MPELSVQTPRTKHLNLNQLLERLRTEYPAISFAEGTRFTWDPSSKQVIYQSDTKDSSHAIFSLLHEVGHALMEHKDYTSDINLLQLEVAAWLEARKLARRYDITLDEDHIEDCLDTYRDWLHLRSTCPNCYTRSLQSSKSLYSCFNCQSSWSVSLSRLCRPYRLKTT